VRTVAGLKAGISVDEAQRILSKSFALAGIESGMTDARALIGAALRLSRAQLLAQSDRLLEPREIAAIDALAARRMKREPVSRILGRKEFWSLMLDVTPDVLVPRPDTETLIEAALDYVVRGGLRLEPLRILDIGTGTGALMLALLQELPNARGVATDVSVAALHVARGNAERLKLASRCSFVACNLADGVQGRFDLIVSNPPYIARGAIASLDPEVRDFDPRLALDGGADGLDAYRAIAASVPPLLAPGGRLIMELGVGQAPPVTALFEAAKFIVLSIRNDLGGIARALIAKIGV
jgi:release factor glutamine methyltransferase